MQDERAIELGQTLDGASAPEPVWDKVIVWRKPDGGIALTRCSADPEKIRVIEQGHHPDLVYVATLDPEEMPDRGKLAEKMDDDERLAARFRRAWDWRRGKVDVDMVKARDVHRDHMRAARAPKLRDLDVEYDRADEAEDKAKKRAVAAKKQALRDVTAHPAIEAATTLQQLVAVWPEVLK